MDNNLVQRETCQTTAECSFHSAEQWRMRRHELSCNNESSIEYISKCYGGEDDANIELHRIGVLDVQTDEMLQKFYVTWDIESLHQPTTDGSSSKTLIIGRQELLSIAVYAPWSSIPTACFTREDLGMSACDKLISEFMLHLDELCSQYTRRLPQKIFDYIDQIVAELAEERFYNKSVTAVGIELNWSLRYILIYRKEIV